MKRAIVFGMIAAVALGGVAVAVYSQDREGLETRMLLEAVKNNDVEAIDRLLKNHVPVDSRDGRGRTALLLAVVHNQVEAGAMLIRAGANVNIQDDRQNSPLLLAGAEGRVELLRLMVEANPDFSRYNRYGGTALIPAAERGHVEVVQLLLQTPVDVDHVNRLGWTALLEAIVLSQGGPRNQEIVRLLIEAGADVNIPDGDGVTPLQHARSKGFREIAVMLEEAGAR